MSLHRATAAGLSVLYFFTNCALAGATERNLFEERHRAHPLATLASLPETAVFPPSSQGFSSPPRLPAPSLLNQLPASLGAVRATTDATADPAIVYVQDVHRNQEAQRRIGAAVRRLIDGGVTLVALEGAAGAIDLSAFRDGPFADSARRAADGLLADQKISGAAYGAIIADRPARVVGIEDPGLYDANVRAVQEAARGQKKISAALADERRRLTARKTVVFSPALAAFDASVQAYRASGARLGDYADAVTAGATAVPLNVDNFLKAARLERQLDPQRADDERRRLLARLTPRLTAAAASALLADGIAYRTGQMTPAAFYRRLTATCGAAGVPLTDYPAFNHFVRYVITAEAIDSAALAEQLQRLETERYAALATTGSERQLIADDVRLHLEEQLVTLSLTAHEWARYQTMPHDPALAPFERFYEIADARNAAIARNLRAAMKKTGAAHAVLVTGGYHETGVRKALGADLSIATFVPRLETGELGNAPSVISVFCQEKEPLDRLFSGEKLFLATPPVPAEARAGGEVMAAADALRRGAGLPAVNAWLSRVSRFFITRFRSGAVENLELAAADTSASIDISFDATDRPRWPRLHPALLNSWGWSAALAAGATAVSLAANAPLGIAGSLLVFVGVRLWIFARVVGHERAHALEQGQLDGMSALARLQRLAAAVGGPRGRRAPLSFLLGTEIVTAGVPSKNGNAAAIRRVALAGPWVHVRGVAFAAAIVLIGLTVSPGAPALSGSLVLIGSLIFVAEFLLLAVALASDLRHARSGVRPAFYGMSSSDGTFDRPADGDQPVFDFDLSFDGRTTLTDFLRETRELVAEMSAAFVQRRLPLPDNFEQLAPWMMGEIGELWLGRGQTNLALSATIESETFVLRVSARGPDVSDEGLRRIKEQAQRDGWVVTWNDGTGGHRQIEIRARVVVSLGMGDLPENGPDVARMLAASGERAGALRDKIRRFLATLERRNYAGTSDRVRSLLWSGDEASFMSALRMLQAARGRSARALLISDLEQLAVDGPDARTRELATWALGVVDPKPGHFSAFERRDLTSRLATEVRLTAPGVVDIIVRSPVGALSFLAMLLSRLIPSLRGWMAWKTESVIRFTTRVPSEGAGSFSISFPENAPTAGLFGAILHLWASYGSPRTALVTIDRSTLEQIRDLPDNWQWNQPLRDAGFTRAERHMGSNESTAMRRTDNVSRPEDEEMHSPWEVFHVFIRIVGGVLLLYFRNLHVRDEIFHRIGIRIEGGLDTSPKSLWAIQFGLVESAGTRWPMILEGDDYYRRHPWRRFFSTLAAPIGWLVFATVFTGVLITVHQPLSEATSLGAQLLLGWLWLELSLNWLAVFLNLLPLERSDLWRYVKRWRDFLRHPPAARKPTAPLQLPPEVWKDLGLDGDEDGSIWQTALVASGALVARWWTAVRWSFDSQHRAALLVARVRAELARNGQLTRETELATRRLAAPQLRRFRSHPPVAEAAALHEIQWAGLSAVMRRTGSTLVGDDAVMDAQGTVMAEENLRPYFTDLGWRAYQAYRRPERLKDLSAFDGLLAGHPSGRLTLSLAAFRPETVAAFYAAIGRPRSGSRANAAFKTGRERLMVVFDSGALPWSGEFSVESRVAAVHSGRSRSALVRRFISPHEPLIAAISLIERSGAAVPADEIPAVITALRNVLDPSASQPSMYGERFDREILRREIEVATALVPHVEDGSVFSDPFAAIRGIENAAGVTVVSGNVFIPRTGIKPGPAPVFAARDGQSNAFLELTPPKEPPAPPAPDLVPQPLPGGDPFSVADDQTAADRLPLTDGPAMARPISRSIGPRVTVGPSVANSRPRPAVGLAAPAFPPAADAARPPVRATDQAPRPLQVIDVPALPPTVRQGTADDTANAASVVNRTNRAEAERPAAAQSSLASNKTAPSPVADRESQPTLLGSADRPKAIGNSTSRAGFSESGVTTETSSLPRTKVIDVDQSAALAAVARAEASAAQAEHDRRAALTSKGTEAATGSSTALSAPNDSRLVPGTGLLAVLIRASSATVGAASTFGLWSAAALFPHTPLLLIAGIAFIGALGVAVGLAVREPHAVVSLNAILAALRPPLSARAATLALAMSMTAIGESVMSTPALAASAPANTPGVSMAANIPTTRAALPSIMPLLPPSPAAASVQAASNDQAASALAQRVASLSALDGLLALMTAARQPEGTRPLPVQDAVRAVADDRLSPAERASLLELSRATHLAARLALARAVHRAAGNPTAAETAPVSFEVVTDDVRALHDIRRVALVLASIPDADRPGFLPEAERNAAIAHGVAEGRALLVLEEAWAREFVRQPAGETAVRARPHDVPVILLPSRPTAEEKRSGAPEKNGARHPGTAGARADKAPLASGKTPAADESSGADDTAHRPSSGRAQEENLMAGLSSTFPLTVPPIVLASAAGNADRLTSVAVASLGGDQSLPDSAQETNANHEISSSLLPSRDSAAPRRFFSWPLPPADAVSVKGPVADLVRTSFVWAAVGFGAIATFLGLDVRHVLALSLAFLGAVITAGAARAAQRALRSSTDPTLRPLAPAGDGTLPLLDSDLDRLADLLIQFPSHPGLLRTPEGGVQLAALLPEIGTLGVADRRLLSRVAGLTADEADRLEAILAARRRDGTFVPSLNDFEARALMAAVASSGATTDDLRRAIGNKNPFYPVRSQEGADLGRELDGVEHLLAFIRDGQTLYLAVDEGAQEVAVQNRFRDAIVAGRITLLPRPASLIEKRGETDVLNFAALARVLAALGEARARNMVILLPEGMGWDGNRTAGSPLDWVSFVLLRDFIAGVPVARVGLSELGRLAQALSTQA